MLKFTFLSLVFLVAFTACSTKSEEKTATQTMAKEQSEGLKIYAFHGTRQCSTCKNMKAFTKATLDKYFKNELKSGAITFQIIDVDVEQNYTLAEKFEATGTALMVNKVKNGKEKIIDWSNFAFEYANGNQAIFEEKLKKMINDQLN